MPMDTRALTVTQLRLAADAKRVQFSGIETWGVLDDDERVVEDGMGQPVSRRIRELSIANGVLTGVVDGVTLLVGGAPYTVRGRPQTRENGDLLAITLVPA